MPIAAIAGYARRLDSQHGASATGTNCSQQTLKSGAGRAATRAAKVVVDDDHILPTKRPGAGCESVLTSAAFGVVDELVRGRLSHVEKGAARQVIRRDLVHHHPPLALLRARRCIR